MSTAHKGRRNEHRFRDFLLERGWLVIRAAGSKGVADLMALRDKVLIVNVKTNCYAPPIERTAMLDVLTGLRKYGLNVDAVMAQFCDGSKVPMCRVYSFKNKGWVDVTAGWFEQ